MNEKELLFLISRIASRAATFEEAIEKTGALMERELGGKGLIVKEREEGIGGIASAAEVFFTETAHLPSRSLYTVALRANGRELGRLIAFFASAESSDGLRQRVMNFAGEQLGTMLVRLRLAKRRRQLRGEIARIRTNLATRKALQRAEGILGRRGLDAGRARLWLEQQSRQGGQSLIEAANDLFDREMTPIDEPVSVRLTA